MRYLEKEVSGGVDFFHADKYESFLQVVLWFLMGMVNHSESYQNSKFATSLQYLKKEVRDELDFLHVDKHQSFLQIDFSTLSIKAFCKVILTLLMGMIKYSQSTQSNKLVIVSQYLTNEVSQSFFKKKFIKKVLHV